MSKLENDCISVLEYSAKEWPRWVSISELTDELGIPPSTLRNMFLISDRGFYVKTTENGDCDVFSDVFAKIAQKHRFEFVIRKMHNSEGRLTWHISTVRVQYFE